VQGRSNLEALKVVLPIGEVRAYDTAPGVAAEYAAEVSDRFDVTATVVHSPREAVSGCDVVVTAGPIQKHPHRTIQRGWLDAGAFASLVDYDSYFDPAALHEAHKFCTDDIPQLRLAQTAGYFTDIPPIHADLGELATGRKPGRERSEERTLAANLGLAIDDMAVAPLLYQGAQERGIGTWLPL